MVTIEELGVLILLVLVVLGVLIFSCRNDIPHSSTDITLVWDENSESDIIGYNVYYKTSSEEGSPYNGIGLNEGDSPIFTSNTTIRLTGCEKGKQYIFVATAINPAGESKYSNSASCVCGGKILW